MKNDLKPNDNSELPKPQASCCGSSCGCHNKGSAAKTRWIVGVIVLAAAGALVTRAMVKNHSAAGVPASTGFAALPAAVQSSPDGVAAGVDTNAVKEIGSIAELNTQAKDMVGVFVFLPGKTNTTDKASLAPIRSTAQSIERHLKGKIGVFTLKMDSPDYVQVAKQVAAPGVLVMVKGKGMVPVSGELTEAKLTQALVAASTAGGCGPSSGGCGPSGCN
ncbi:MAG: hypothetical protein WCS52_05150 [bacterium]